MANKRKAGKRVTACECPERLTDMLIYRTHFCRDGKRLDPFSIYPESFGEYASMCFAGGKHGKA